MQKKTRAFFKNLKSQYFEQGIFAGKKKTADPGSCSDVVREAEQIVENYLEKLGYNPVALNKKHAKKALILNISVILLVVAAVMIAARLII